MGYARIKKSVEVTPATTTRTHPGQDCVPGLLEVFDAARVEKSRGGDGAAELQEHTHANVSSDTAST